MSLGEILKALQGCRALVVGDVMLDEYIFGKATRISQEAPVMVVRQESTSLVPGGAANVALNMAALGGKVSVVGVVGCDAAGESLSESLRAAGISPSGLVRDAHRPTTRKTRVLANHAHQVLRIDHEDEHPVDGKVEQSVLEQALEKMLQSDVVLVSDYRKGSVTQSIVETLVREATSRKVPVVANPKPQSLPFYRGAALVSLNRYEAGSALGYESGLPDSEAEPAAAQLRERLGVENLLITLGASGMAAATSSSTFSVPAIRVAVYDEAGAGDTVIATVSMGMAARAFSQDLLTLAAHTAAAVVRKVGVAAPSPEDLAEIARQ